MRVCILDEVVELLRQKRVVGWAEFASAFHAFRIRHGQPGESEICTMTKMWRYIISAGHFGELERSDALSSLNDTDSHRQWVVNFKHYVLCLLVDIYAQLEDYHE